MNTKACGAVRKGDYLSKGRMYPRSYGLRLLVVVVSMAAWFVTGNHCVLAATPAAGKASGCPMHAQKQHAPQPKNGNGCGDLQCCKNLQATVTVSAKAVAKPVWLGALQPFFKKPVIAIELGAPQVSPIHETGPPGKNSFAELVLQRSIFAHAPPVSLS